MAKGFLDANDNAVGVEVEEAVEEVVEDAVGVAVEDAVEAVEVAV